MNAAVVIATYNERENLPGLVSAILQNDGYRVIVVDDDSPDGTGAIADELAAEFRRPGVGDSSHGRARPGPLARRGTQARAVGRRRSDFPDGRGFLPRSEISARDGRGRGGRRSRARIPLPARRQRRELAAAPNHPQQLRQSLHPSGHRARADRLHDRIPMLAARGARAAAARSADLRRLRVPGRAAPSRAALGCRVREVPIIFVERREGASKISSRVLLESVIVPWRLRLKALVY